ncbi:hypothetical protein JIG36_25685 [Actinoplanes sp. LDG1-06]|uniref:3-hydroxyacyl-CoA dehydrogenase n=1 Tax=Paractinoplanes ovalisporus TaxID=2810368 RepID=A0ABS2AGL1_9ACTN|nr:hypothetical protein [Actinoplanes ovalisporus]
MRPTPRCEPPFDDELEPTVWATAQQLALDWPSQRATPDAAREPAIPPQHSPIAGASAEAKLAVRRFVATCVEVLNGHRPAAHLRRLSSPMDAQSVVAQGMAAAHRVADFRRARGRRPTRRVSPVAVIHVRLCEPRPGAVEAAVALVTGERTWALALRLELHQDSWRATTLRLI